MASRADVDDYFARIEYTGSRDATLPVLHAITAAHSQSIPFENLDVLLGRPIELDEATLFAKLVRQHRGGYCFEQNGLLLRVLEELGFKVIPLGARVRLQRPREYIPPRTHLCLRVEVGGESWLTDVGVGAASLTSAIRLDTDAEQSTGHEPRRIVREGARYFHQVRFGSEWTDVYEFTLEEMPPIDRELANWFTSAHPRSHFKSCLMVARALPAGRRVSVLDRELSIREGDGQCAKREIGSPEELLEVLAEHFGLRFPASTRFGAPGSPWPT